MGAHNMLHNEESNQLLRAILRCGTEKHSWKTCSALEFDLFYIHDLPIRKH